MYAKLSMLAAVTLILVATSGGAPASGATGAAMSSAAAGQSSAPGAGLAIRDGAGFSTLPPAAWAPADPGDSLYRAARQLLNGGHYVEAAGLLTDLIRRYPRSTYAPDAHYWAAFALYRTGDDGNLRRATTLLEYESSHYPRAATRGDGDALLARVYGELARRGDPRAGEWVQSPARAAVTRSAQPERRALARTTTRASPR